MPARRLAYKPDAATEVAIEELSLLSNDPSSLQRRSRQQHKRPQSMPQAPVQQHTLQPFSRYSYQYQDEQQHSHYQEVTVGEQHQHSEHTYEQPRSASSPPAERRKQLKPAKGSKEYREQQQQQQHQVAVSAAELHRDSPDAHAPVPVPSENGSVRVKLRRKKHTDPQSRQSAQQQRRSAGMSSSFVNKCSQCNGFIFGGHIKCAACGNLAHNNDRCAHVTKKERKRDGFDWYCSSHCMLAIQQALPFYGSLQKLGAHASQLHVAVVDLGSLLKRKFAVWTMLAQEQYDALIIFNANMPKKSDAQHLKFTGYALYFDEDRRHAVYAKAELKPRRFLLPENKDDVLKLNGGNFSSIVIGFQQRSAATVSLLSRPDKAEDHGRFRCVACVL